MKLLFAKFGSFYQLHVTYFFLCAVFIAYTYFPALHHYFLADDGKWILHSMDIHNVIKPINGYVRPATALYFHIMFRLFGLFPMPYHLMNILFHFLNICVFSFCVKELLVFFKGKDNDSSFPNVLPALSVFFSSIPLCVFAALLWVSSIHDILMTFFYLLSLLFAFKSMNDAKPLLFIPSFFSFAFALLFKEHAVTLPFVLLPLLIMNASTNSEKIKIAAGYTGILLMFLISYFTLTSFQEHSLKLSFQAPKNFFILSVEAAASFFGFTLHPRMQEAEIRVFFKILQFLSMASFAAIVAPCRKIFSAWHQKIISFSLYFFTINVFPLCFFTYLSTPLDAFAARYRYFYLPFFGLSLCFSCLLSAGLNSKQGFAFRKICLAVLLFTNANLNIMAINIPVSGYGWMSGMNATLVQKILHSPYIFHRKNVVVINDEPAFSVLQHMLKYYLHLYLEKEVNVRWLTTREFMNTLPNFTPGSSVFIVLTSDTFLDSTVGMDKILRATRKP